MTELAHAVTPSAVPPAAGAPDVVDHESTTRARVLQLIISEGPVTTAALAASLHLTTAGIRRHIGCLEEADLVTVREGRRTGTRGRPARAYVATERAHASRNGGYTDIAAQALHFIEETVGELGVEEFANKRLAAFEERYAPQITAPDVRGRVEQLAGALSADGFAASVRPVGGALTVQLCQGHCPIQHVAAQFPQLCDAESRVFSRLLGSHTQRLVTLANGGHVCTTNVPVLAPTPPPVPG